MALEPSRSPPTVTQQQQAQVRSTSRNRRAQVTAASSYASSIDDVNPHAGAGSNVMGDLFGDYREAKPSHGSEFATHRRTSPAAYPMPASKRQSMDSLVSDREHSEGGRWSAELFKAGMMAAQAPTPEQLFEDDPLSSSPFTFGTGKGIQSLSSFLPPPSYEV